MNKRHYEHTLPNIRGSLSNTYTETITLRERMKIEQKGLEKCSKYEQVKRKKGSANKKTGKCDNLCFCS